MQLGFKIATCTIGMALATSACTPASYRGDKADWTKTSARVPADIASCIADGWDAGQHRHKMRPNPKGYTLVIEGGAPEAPWVDAVVDVEAQGKGSEVRYGGRLRSMPTDWGAEAPVLGCL